MKHTNKKHAPRRSREWGERKRRIMVIRTRETEDRKEIEALKR